jgi:hypothetical protein
MATGGALLVLLCVACCSCCGWLPLALLMTTGESSGTGLS